eukprot:1841011-Rhodomonas_salina.1
MGKFSGGGAAQKFEEREWRVKYRELFAKEGTRDQNPTDAGLKPRHALPAARAVPAQKCTAQRVARLCLRGTGGSH